LRSTLDVAAPKPDVLGRLRDLLLGPPLPNQADGDERIGALAGVPVLGLDALASAAYGPEALLTVLIALGIGGLRYVTPLTFLIVGILFIVFISYRQTIEAYPNGGGAYTVARENLGKFPSLLAAAALALDYLLNVAVAISAGVGALVSAVPWLLPHTLALCLGVLALLTLVNLRGARTTGFVFMLPTILFVGTLGTVIVVGAVRVLSHGGHPQPVIAPETVPVTGTVTLWLLLRAFSNGCTAMTGVEAVSNGVPMFRPPITVLARRTLTLIIAVLMFLLVGIAALCRAYGITATPPGTGQYKSVLSQLVSAVFGGGIFYYVTMGSTFALLALSANTSFSGFPGLCRLVARDRFLPEKFAHRGRRLVFSHGMVVLSCLAGALLIVFRGITDALIPLFAIGAFLAFTMSQAGMVMHWRRRGGKHAARSLVVNAVGAVATGVTLTLVLVSKFTEGAWITVLLVAGMIALMCAARSHYEFVERATDVSAAPVDLVAPRRVIAVIPIRRWDAVALKALRFAFGVTSRVIVVRVVTGEDEDGDLRRRWAELAEGPARRAGHQPPELVELCSEYRLLFAPLVDYVSTLAKENPDEQVAVVVPELVERRWYQYFLHEQTAALLKAALFFQGGPQIVVIDTPYYLRDWAGERSRVLSTRPPASARTSAPVHRSSWTPST
jgi:amino acid transporter